MSWLGPCNGLFKATCLKPVLEATQWGEIGKMEVDEMALCDATTSHPAVLSEVESLCHWCSRNFLGLYGFYHRVGAGGPRECCATW